MKTTKTVHPNYLPASLIADYPRNSIIVENGQKFLVMSDEVTAYCAADEHNCDVVNLTTIPGWFGLKAKDTI